jgi:hypothetical protein
MELKAQNLITYRTFLAPSVNQLRAFSCPPCLLLCLIAPSSLYMPVIAPGCPPCSRYAWDRGRPVLMLSSAPAVLRVTVCCVPRILLPCAHHHTVRHLDTYSL